MGLSGADTGLAARRAALDLLRGVLEDGQSLMVLTGARGALQALAPAARAEAQRLAAQVLRDLARADALLDRFLRKPPPGFVRNILRLAAVEMLALGVAPHGAVDAAVRLVRARPEGEPLAGLVNAIGRKLADQGPGLWPGLPPAPLPSAFADPIRRVWGKAALRQIEAAHALPPPLDLSLSDPGAAQTWAEKLGGLALPGGTVRLMRPGQVSALPGHDSGDWWVQDWAAAMPARALGDVAGLRVLDLCAAPGGKTLQLAAAGALVTALDISAARLERLRENLARTRLEASLIAADALDWQPEVPFDVVLLDAPCSATGTIRRHPDLPHVKAGWNLDLLVHLQARLLDRAAGWVVPGGRLAYATCSLIPAEGEAQFGAFLERSPGFAADAPAPVAGLEAGWIDPRQRIRLRPDFWPDIGGMDGFFCAIAKKTQPAA